MDEIGGRLSDILLGSRASCFVVLVDCRCMILDTGLRSASILHICAVGEAQEIPTFRFGMSRT
jgi:hypothetical protein